MHMDAPCSPPAEKRLRISPSEQEEMDEASLVYLEDEEQDQKPLLNMGGVSSNSSVLLIHFYVKICSER